MAKKLIKHEVTVNYTIDDDGIWLYCNCGWEHNMSWNNHSPPTVGQISYVSRKHIEKTKKKGIV